MVQYSREGGTNNDLDKDELSEMTIENKKKIRQTKLAKSSSKAIILMKNLFICANSPCYCKFTKTIDM